MSAGAFSLGTLIVQIEAAVDKAAADIQKFGDDCARAAEEQSKNWDGFTKSLDRTSAALTGMGAILTAAVTAPLAGVAALGINAAASFEKIVAGLRVFEGSAADTQKRLESLKEVAKLPGLGLEEAVQGYTRLRAVGVAADDAQKYLTVFGNALATVGKGREDLAAVVTQLQQMSAKSQVVAEDLKPIIERVPQAAGIIRAAYGTIDTEVLQKLGVSTQDFIKTVVDGLEKLPPVATTLSNAFENLRDTTSQTLAKIGDIFTPALKAILPLVEQFANKLGDVAEWFSKLPGPVQAGALAIAGLAAALGPVLLIAGQVAGAVSAIIAVLAEFGLSAGAVAAALIPMAGQIAAVTVALAALGTWVYSHWDNITAALSETWNSLTKIWGGVWDDIAGALKGAWADIETTGRGIWDGIVSFYSSIWDGVKFAWRAAWDTTTAILQSAWQGIKAAAGVLETVASYLVPFWEPVKQAFTAAWESISGWLEGAWGKIHDTATTIWGAIRKVFADTADASKQELARIQQQQDEYVKATQAQNAALRGLNTESIADLEANVNKAKVAYATVIAEGQRRVDAARAAGIDLAKIEAENARNAKEAALAITDAQKKLEAGGKFTVAAQKEAEAAAKKAADAAKKAAAEQEKLFNQIDALNTRLADSQVKLAEQATKLAIDYGKAHEKMAADAKKQVDITVPLFGRIPPAIQEAVTASAKLQQSFKELGQTSEQDLRNNLARLVLDFKNVQAAQQKGLATNADVANSIQKLNDANKKLIDLTGNEVVKNLDGVGTHAEVNYAKAVAASQKYVAQVQADVAAGRKSQGDLNAALDVLYEQQAAAAVAAQQKINTAYKQLGLQSIAVLDGIAARAKVDYAAIAADAGANSLVAKEAQIKATEEAYQAQLARGIGLTEAQKTELAKQQIAVEEFLAAQVSQYKIAYEAIKGAVSGAFDDLIKKLVTGDGSFGDIMTKLWQSIAEDCLHYFLNPIRDAIAKFIATTIADLLSGNGFGGIKDALEGIASAFGKLFGKGVSTAADVAGGAAQAGAGAAQAGGGAASAAGGILSAGVTSLVSMVSGVISAVTGVIGVFQAAHQETSLNAIEHNTRYSMMYLGERADGGILGVLFHLSENTDYVQGLLDGVNAKLITYGEPLKNGMASLLTKVDAAQARFDQIADNSKFDVQLGTEQNALLAEIRDAILGQKPAVNIYVSGAQSPSATATEIGAQLRAQGAFA